MKCFIVNVHSVVDFITNSSTEIFTWGTKSSVTAARSLLETLLSALGVSGKVDDYFEIGLVNEDYKDRCDMRGQFPEVESMSWEEYEEWARNTPEAAITRGNGEYPGTMLEIRLKSDPSIDLVAKVLGLLGQEAEANY
jgi:hypothetical protein